MSDLNQLPLEQLAALPEWMVPPGRKSELEAYLAKKRRGDDSPDRSPEEQQREVEEARGRAGLNPDGTTQERMTAGPSSSSTGKQVSNAYRFTDKDSSSYGYPYGSQQWLEALDWPNEAERPMISRNRLKAMKLGMGKPDADQITRSPSGQWPPPQRGPRGGRYTEARTRDGRPYRRYF